MTILRITPFRAASQGGRPQTGGSNHPQQGERLVCRRAEWINSSERRRPAVPRWPHLSSLCAALLLVAVPFSVTFAAPPSDTLYPANTRGFVSVSNVEQLGEAWDRTRL